MKAKKTYAVFGLGRYGMAVAKELVENGRELIAVDSDEKSLTMPPHIYPSANAPT